MRRNEDIQKDVQAALKWEPTLKVSEIGVIVSDGIVTLTGTVDSYSKKSEAEDAAKSVAGVKAVVEEIKIKYNGTGKKDDAQIAADILSAFTWNWEFPSEKVKVKVEAGWVTLEGELNWNYQRESAKNSVKNISGVLGVTNQIKISHSSDDEIEKRDIEHALERNWAVDDRNIKVHVTGSQVTLNGKVHSLYQKDEAGRIAWKAPGVLTVANELVVEYN